jgi:thiamine biosynthesis protein ThiC
MDDGKFEGLRRYQTGQAINFRMDNKLGHITETIAQLVVPKSIRSNLLFLMHEGMGHTERNRTLSNIRSKYYWPNQAADVVDHVKKRYFYQQQKKKQKQMATLKDEIASYVKNTTMDTWDEFLSLAAFHYNTTVNEATTFTPFFMIHGREASTLKDAHLCQFVEKYCSFNAYIEQMRKALMAV